MLSNDEIVKDIIEKWKFETQARDWEGVTTVLTKDIKYMIKWAGQYFKDVNRDPRL